MGILNNVSSTNNTKKSSGGLLVGILMIIIGSVLLVFNEKNNVANIKTVDELKKQVINVSSDEINSNNEGKLVATNGDFVVEDASVSDPTFNVSLKTAILKRTVEVYQWEEKKEEEDNTTRYTYTKTWSEDLIDSSKFNDNSYTNPSTKSYDSEKYTSKNVKVGSFSLSSTQIDSLDTNKNVTLEGMEGIYLRSGYNIKNNYITNSVDFENPQIGDFRIKYTYNDYKDASVLAVQSGNSFTGFTSKAGKTINRVFEGKLNGNEMILKIEDENNTLKWILRVVGGLVIIFGYMALVSGLNRLLEYIPLIGKVASSMISLIAAIVGIIHALVIIIIAWFRYRPVLSIVLIVVIVLLVLLIKSKKKKNPVENNNTQVVNNQEPTTNIDSIPVVNNQDNVTNSAPVETNNIVQNNTVNNIETTNDNKEEN